MSRVNVGDVRRAHGRDYVVMSVERGRSGESRTVYVVGERVGDRVLARETRGSSVRDWPRVARLRLRVRRTAGGLSATVAP